MVSTSRDPVPFLLLAILFCSSVLTGQDRLAAESAAREYFTDTVLIDQRGEEKRFYSDLVKGRVVVINSFFTSCQATCPIMAKSFQKLQEWLGDRLGSEVFLISISVDPQTDTPQRLLAYSDRFGARPGWYFLSGREDNVRLVLSKLGQFVEQREGHQNLILIGNEPTGLWKKVFGLSEPEVIVQALESTLKDQE